MVRTSRGENRPNTIAPGRAAGRSAGHEAVFLAVTLTGAQIGSPASRSGGTPHTVTLANGATTHALVLITDTGVYPPSLCHAVTAAGLRVYPPNLTRSKVVPFPFSACSKTGTIYLSISTVGFP